MGQNRYNRQRRKFTGHRFHKPDCTLTTDASRCPKTSAAAWAVWLSFDDGPLRYSGVFKKDPADINEAEAWAIRNGLFFAQRLGFERIHVNTDSETAMRRLQGLQTPGMQVRYQHVRAHTGVADSRSYVNRQVDKIAGQLMRKERQRRQNHAARSGNISRSNNSPGGNHGTSKESSSKTRNPKQKGD